MQVNGSAWRWRNLPSVAGDRHGLAGDVLRIIRNQNIGIVDIVSDQQCRRSTALKAVTQPIKVPMAGLESEPAIFQREANDVFGRSTVGEEI
jgi:hypothetical protein